MRKQNSSTAGFTIVELLIVIVVIAILATISIVAFRGIQERARASEATSGLAQAKKKLELYKVDNSTYPTSGNLASAGVSDSDVSYQYTSDGSAYCLTATVGTTSYTATNTSSPTQGGCAGHGQGGVAAITNLILNPSVESNITDVRGYGSTNISSMRTNLGATAFGSYSINLASPSNASSWGVQFKTDTIQPNAQYTSSLYSKRTNGGSPANLAIEWWTSSNTYIGASTVAISPVTGNWIRTNSTITSPSNAAYAYVNLYYPTITTSDNLYIDGVMLTHGSTLYNYADGTSPNWIWNGAPNNSTSTGPSL